MTVTYSDRPYRPVADHLDALRDIAADTGFELIYDSGPCDGKMVLFADAEGARDYLNGKGIRGRQVEVRFDRHGQVEKARLRRDTVAYADVSGDRGNAGRRLQWTMAMFEQATYDPRFSVGDLVQTPEGWAGKVLAVADDRGTWLYTVEGSNACEEYAEQELLRV